MSVMKRLTGVLQAKANKVLDRVEDPRETLDLSYEKQLEQLQQVRRGVADVATARKRIELQAQQLQQSATKLQDQARQALAENREDLAREALTRRSAIATQLEGLKGQHDQLVTQEEHLVTTTQQLQTRVEAFRTQKETMKASYTAAEAQTKIGEAVSGISESMSDTGLAMVRAQDKIAQMQARAGAVDELLASGALTDLTGSSDSIQAELDKTASQGQVDLELAQLKGQLATGAPSGEIGPGTPTEATISDASENDHEVAEGEVAEAPKAAPDLFSLDPGFGRMIVRILGEGQFEVGSDTVARLDHLDKELDAAITAGEESRFTATLAAILDEVRSRGRRLDAGTLVPSDLALPPAGSTLAETKSLLTSEEIEA